MVTGSPVAKQEGRRVHSTSSKISARSFNEVLKAECGIA